MTEQAADPASTPSPLREQALRVLRLSWVPLAASLVSLVLSIGSIVIATREPSVAVLVPDQIRFVQGEGREPAYAYLQPTFVGTGANDRVEVIRDMRLELTPEGGETVEFAWDEVGRLDYDPSDGSLTYVYLADAVPMLIGRDAAQNPLALFQGPSGWHMEPGTYRVELVAEREVAQGDLRASFDVTLAPEDVEFLTEAEGERFLTLPVQEP